VSKWRLTAHVRLEGDTDRRRAVAAVEVDELGGAFRECPRDLDDWAPNGGGVSATASRGRREYVHTARLHGSAGLITSDPP
jgi:hypothetical protein